MPKIKVLSEIQCSSLIHVTTIEQLLLVEAGCYKISSDEMDETGADYTE